MLASAYRLGFQAYLDGTPMGDCPFDENTPRCRKWINGWNDAWMTNYHVKETYSD